MGDISITNTTDRDGMWEFAVRVDGKEYTVTLSRAYFERLTGGRGMPEELVERSFEFLLEREAKESILPSFDLETVNSYFPGYEQEIINKYANGAY